MWEGVLVMLVVKEVIRSRPGKLWAKTAEVPSSHSSSWAFGTASDGEFISAEVAAYHYGSLNSSAWIAFCMLLLFSQENVQSSRVRFSAGAMG